MKRQLGIEICVVVVCVVFSMVLIKYLMDAQKQKICEIKIQNGGSIENCENH